MKNLRLQKSQLFWPTTVPLTVDIVQGIVQGTPIQPNAPPVRTTYAYSGESNVPIGGVQRPVLGPPEGRWRDGICDCFTNLWPSCGCLFVCNGTWIIAQSKYWVLFFNLTVWNSVIKFCFVCALTVAHKTGFTRFHNIAIPLLVLNIICFWVSLFFNRGLYFIPLLVLLVLGVVLRLHVVKHYNIAGNCLQECCIGFWCWSCSIAQSKYCFLLCSFSLPPTAWWWCLVLVQS